MTPGSAPARPGTLRDKVALVTGAASGIGKATALLFAREGAAVVLFDLDEPGGRATARAIEDEGGRALFVRGDVTRDADARRAVVFYVAQTAARHMVERGNGVILQTASTSCSTTPASSAAPPSWTRVRRTGTASWR